MRRLPLQVTNTPFVRFLGVLLIVGATGLGLPGVCWAQDEAPAPAPETDDADEEEEEDAAAKHFANGRRLYGAGKYAEAIEELLKAYKLRPAPPILLNIGLTALNPYIAAFGLGQIEVAMIKHIEFMVFGFLIIFFLIVEPSGFARLWQITKQKLRTWPFPY